MRFIFPYPSRGVWRPYSRPGKGLSPPDVTEFSARLKAGAHDLSNVHARLARHRASCATTKVRPHWAKRRAKHRIALALEQCAPIPAKGATGPRRLASSPSAGLRLSLQEKQEAIMNFQFLWRGMTARPARHLKARSSLVRRLVQAHDDPVREPSSGRRPANIVPMSWCVHRILIRAKTSCQECRDMRRLAGKDIRSFVHGSRGPDSWDASLRKSMLERLAR